MSLGGSLKLLVHNQREVNFLLIFIIRILFGGYLFYASYSSGPSLVTAGGGQ